MARDGKNIYVLGARRIAEERVARRNDDDIRLDHAPTVATRGLCPPREVGHTRGSTRSGEIITLAADVARISRCDCLAMYSGYPAIWSAKLLHPQMQAITAIEPVNVVVRIVFNTLDGIVNDYFVITASAAAR